MKYLLFCLFFVSCQKHIYIYQKADIVFSNKKPKIILLDSMKILPKDTIIKMYLIYKKRL